MWKMEKLVIHTLEIILCLSVLLSASSYELYPFEDEDVGTIFSWPQRPREEKFTRSSIIQSQLYDVTTIYRLQEGPRSIQSGSDNVILYPNSNRRESLEIHARTNAMGFPFLITTNDSTISGPTVGIEFAECYPDSKSGCENWFKINWKIINSPVFETAPLLTQQSTSTIWTSGHNVSASMNYNEKEIKVIFQPRYVDGTIKIFLLDKKDAYKTSNMYYLQIPNGAYFAPEAHLLKCISSSSNGRDWFIPGEDIYRNCESKQASNNDFKYWKTDKQYIIYISILKDTIKVSIEYDDYFIFRKDLFIWEDSDLIDVNYYAVTTLNMQGKFTLTEGHNNILSLNDMEGSLISQKFTPCNKKLCISLVYYLTPSEENSLKLGVRFEDGNELVLKDMEKSNEWQMKRFITEIPSNATLENIKLVLRGTKSLLSNVLVQRLASCNVEGEDIFVFPDNHLPEYTGVGYDVAVNRVKSNDQVMTHKNCQHGGLVHENSGKCICPAGFVGDVCEKGCGPNSYGNDCGGRCSWSKRGCRKMKLCRANLGCSCAPGFSGYICNIPCRTGYYGPNCAYDCGRCNTSVCNPYTGTCPHGCNPGYRSPLCKETYMYVTTAPLVVSGYNELSISTKITPNKISGSGNPIFYQFQYREESQSESWIKMESQFLGTSSLQEREASINVTGLQVGRKYHVRIILIDEDGNSFEGSEIPYATSETLCDVPDAVPLQLETKNISATGFTVSWKFERKSDKWCPVKQFETQIKEDWRWISYSNKTDLSFSTSELLPGMMYKMRVRAHFSNSYTGFSEVISVKTYDEAPSEVVDLMVKSTSSQGLTLSWNKPHITAGNIKHYTVSYECIKLLGCHNTTCNESPEQLEVLNTSVTLNKLKSNAMYKVVAAAVSGTRGSPVEIFAFTGRTLPHISPKMSSVPTSEVSNSSLSVHWVPPKDCTHLNGYILGYYYLLIKENQFSDVIMFDGNTTRTQTTFTGLQAYTQYLVKVYLLTTEGWNEEYPLRIPVKTLANAPEKVQNLTVYKRSRKMVGLRWSAPEQTYGSLESFVISYHLHETPSSKEIHKRIKPTPCSAWNNYYCFTLHSLQADKNYIVSVRARNSEVETDGEAATISMVTKESAPGRPEFLKLTGQGNTSLSFEWGIPKHINGQLRSFIISIEETDSYNDTDCCQYFPVDEIVPTMERSTYSLEITGLRPASTYVVSVSAKTVTIGPSVNITAHTVPPVPELEGALTVIVPAKANESVSITIEPSTSYEELISGYLLLLLPVSSEEESNITSDETKIWNSSLQEELGNVISGDFYLVGEYQQTQLVEDNVVLIGKGLEGKTSGQWGELIDLPLLSGATYKVGLVLILHYYDALSIGYTESDEFTIM